MNINVRIIRMLCLFFLCCVLTVLIQYSMTILLHIFFGQFNIVYLAHIFLIRHTMYVFVVIKVLHLGCFSHVRKKSIEIR